MCCQTTHLSRNLKFFLIALLCLAAYAPTLSIPLISDDYTNVSQARVYGSTEGLKPLFSDATFRLRATSYWVFDAVWSQAGLSTRWCHTLSLFLHILSTFLLYLLAAQWAPMRKGAFWAAAFFGVYEGHQEAVMWYSAINELLLFVFGVGAILCRLRGGKSEWWNVPGLLLFALALLSKESALIILPLLLLVRPKADWQFWLYICAAVPAVLSIMESRTHSFRFSDGSFSLNAPFWLTMPRSTFRLLWIWGLLFLIVWVARKQPVRPLRLAFTWITIALIPDSFLTYSTAIPSRQIYLASAGLAMFIGIGLEHLLESSDRRFIWALAAAMLIHNAGTLWTKKRLQFIERAAPTELLLQRVRLTTGPINIRCFALSRFIAEESVRLTYPAELPRLVWGDSESACLSRTTDTF